MEKELRLRLVKVLDEQRLSGHPVEHLLNITTGTLQALRAHINETRPFRAGDITSLDETIEILTDYQ